MRCIIATGWSLDDVLGLDILQFNALMSLIVKIQYADRTQSLWADCAAINAGMSGKTDGLKKITKTWAAAGGESAEEIAKKTGSDARAFLGAFGLSSGGKI